MSEVLALLKRTLRSQLRTFGAAALIVAAAFAPLGGTAQAHAFGQRYDLPIPLSYFLAGAAAAVALSFVVMGMFIKGGESAFRYPRLNLLAMPALGRILTSRILLGALRIASVALLLLVIAAALFGSDNPLANLSPTFIWIIWWVGMGYIAALFGNFWMLINPWKTLFEWGEWLARRIRGGQSDGRGGGLIAYPRGWDVMPALLGFFAFVWLENVYPGSVVPRYLAALALVYSLITLGGMALFGKHTWLRYCDCFSVLFGIFARFSPTEVRAVGGNCAHCDFCAIERGDDDADECVDCYACFEAAGDGDSGARREFGRGRRRFCPARGDSRARREFNLRPWAVGLMPSRRVSLIMAAFVALTLAAVTFDGLQETASWVAVQKLGLRLFGAGGVSVADTLGVALTPALFFAAYLAFCIGVKALSDEQAPLMEVAQAYVFSLVPIALAYNMAHFLSLLLVQGQLIIPLASDPFGFGWDIFGTAGYRTDPTVISTKAAWFLSVGAIVAGHIVSVYIAHAISLRRAANRSLALRGQYPMLALMVFYTAVSLWIIAQPIVNS